MDPKVTRKTQDTLGKIIKRPPLTDKLLAKPPFRFLHDIITSVINTTGFMQGLFSPEEQNSDNVKDKESKIAFLQKALEIVSLVTGRQLSMKPSKVVAGHEPDKTNEFLQILAEAINKQVDNDSFVQHVLSSRETNKSHEPNKEKSKSRDKSRDKSSSRRSEKEKSREKGDRKESSRSQPDRHKEKDENENKVEEKDRHKGKDEEKERRRSKTEEKAKDKERHHRSRNEEKEERERDQEKEREKDRENGRSEEKSKEKRSSEKERSSRKARKDDTKENEKPPIEKKESDEKIEDPTPRRLQRPTSAKGSRQKREDRGSKDEESEASPAPPPPTHNESPKQPVEDPPSQPTKPVPMARPSSARPAPPKPRKSDVITTDPIIQLGSGRPTNVITDDAQESDEDEQFIVEDNTPLQTKSSLTKEPDVEDETEHGGLVKKILETKKELEGADQTERTSKTQVETSSMKNAAYQKQRHLVVQKIEKLQESIQTLTKSANPLGKIMDYIQEDLDSMQKELYKWKEESHQHTMALKHEKEITERTVEPLKLQLNFLEQAIGDQMDVISTVKANIIRNDKRIVSMLHSVAKV